MCTQVVGSLMALEQLDEKAEIRMYINSPGGSPYAVLGLVDTMLSIKPPIQTLALGACYSYASLVLVSRERAVCHARQGGRQKRNGRGGEGERERGCPVS